jgi:hypothetical protein
MTTLAALLLNPSFFPYAHPPVHYYASYRTG